MQQEFESQIGLPWLVRLRWFAFAGQIGFLIAAHLIFAADFPWLIIGAVLGLGVLSNAMLHRWVHHHPHHDPHITTRASRIVAGILILDTLLLSALLGVSGGATNPFSILFLVHITLAATVLGAGWTLAIALLSVLCFAALFVLPPHAQNAHHHHSPHGTSDGFTSHLHGMWIAFTLAATLVAFFVSRIAHTIAQQRDAIATLRESAARHARLASLTTLAAGAAHELGTPLGTIALAAHDLDLALAQQNNASLRDDAQLILHEVERCRHVLSTLASGTSVHHTLQSSADHIDARIPLASLDQALRERIGHERMRDVQITCDHACATLVVPREHTLQSLGALINNSIDATLQRHINTQQQAHIQHAIGVTITRDPTHVHFRVTDHGIGMNADMIARAGEPFFTTKEAGHGLGLGLFLARAFAESHGGQLCVDSGTAFGTRVTLSLALSALSFQGRAT